MYPDFQHLLQALFGYPMPAWLGIFKTFGFLVALAFFSASWWIIKELKRKEQEGLIFPIEKEILIGEGPKIIDLLTTALVSFMMGFKLGGLIRDASAASDPMSYFISWQGNWAIGFILAIGFTAFKYYEDLKTKLPKPQYQKQLLFPHQRVTEILLIGAVAGFIGAKLFNAFETWDDFIANPIHNLISNSGFTFYGGLIMATIALFFWAKKNKIHFPYLCDATAAALMLAYGVGRMGCQLAGDGDWGVNNSAYVTTTNAQLELVDSTQYNKVILEHANYFKAEFGTVNPPHIRIPAPSFLPRWLFAQNYAHNVNHAGRPIENCHDNYCNVLPVGVFPTTLYESILGILLALFLWSVRKKFKYPFQFFGLYLILNGLERFLVEKIRVNYKYDWGFIHPTQAEIISFSLMLIGVFLLFRKKNLKTA